MKSLLLLALFFPCAVLSQTKDISGTWVAKMNSPMGDSEVVYELKVDPTGKITGAQKLPFGDSPIVDGHVDGDQVTMTVETESFGTLTRSAATAVIAGDELRITPAMPNFGGRGAAEVVVPAPPEDHPMGCLRRGRAVLGAAIRSAAF